MKNDEIGDDYYFIAYSLEILSNNLEHIADKIINNISVDNDIEELDIRKKSLIFSFASIYKKNANRYREIYNTVKNNKR